MNYIELSHLATQFEVWSKPSHEAATVGINDKPIITTLQREDR